MDFKAHLTDLLDQGLIGVPVLLAHLLSISQNYLFPAFEMTCKSYVISFVMFNYFGSSWVWESMGSGNSRLFYMWNKNLDQKSLFLRGLWRVDLYQAKPNYQNRPDLGSFGMMAWPS